MAYSVEQLNKNRWLAVQGVIGHKIMAEVYPKIVLGSQLNQTNDSRKFLFCKCNIGRFFYMTSYSLH